MDGYEGPIPDAIQKKVIQKVENIEGDIIQLLQDLVRIPSINHPPDGDELACQEYVAHYLEGLGLTPDVYTPYEVEGIKDHPAWWGARDYTRRPNVSARLKGSGGGRSLVISGHIDTVPLGVHPWQRDPFAAIIEEGKLYGLGAYDMKSGVAIALATMRVIKDLGLNLKGDLIVETVVDEENGGVNGTLAGRVRGYIGEGMIITEPSGLVIWNGNRGGRVAHLTFGGEEGIGLEGGIMVNAIDQLTRFLTGLEDFRKLRWSHVPGWKTGNFDPVPVWVTKIYAGGWGPNVPQTVPSECFVELYWQLLPGETQDEVDSEFFNWLKNLIGQYPSIFIHHPKVEFTIRWMPGSTIPEDSPFVIAFRSVAERMLNKEVKVELCDGPSDLYVVNDYFPTRAIHFGVRGGNAHAADEYINLEDLARVTKIITLFTLEWCGLDE
jgi:acetylornithine deacetylase